MSLFLILLLSFAQTQNPAPNPLQQAGAQMQQGNFAQAVAILEPVVEAQPQNAIAWYWLGYAYHAQKD